MLLRLLMTCAVLLCIGPLWANTSATTPYRAQALTLNTAPTKISLEPFLTYFCDTTSKETVTSIQQKTFNALPNGHATLGFQPGNCWLHFQVQNTGTHTLSLILLLNDELMDHVQLFDLGAPEPQSWHFGSAEPFANRPIKTHLFALPLNIQQGSTHDYYLRVSSIHSMFLPLSLSNPQAFVEEQIPREWIMGSLYGVGIGLCLYNFLLGISLRERTYFIYSLYVASGLLMLGSFQGINFQLWPDWPLWNTYSHQNFIYLTCFFATLFTREYLDTRSWPAADRWLCGIASIIVLMLASQLVISPSFITKPQGLVGSITICIVFTISVLRWCQGMAGIYVLAWGALLFAGIVTALGGYGIIPWALAALTVMQVAFALQQLLLAFGLSHRINALKKEKTEREHETAHALAANEAKSEFLAKMSHEVRTPLNAVLGITQILQGPPLSAEEQQRHLDTLYSAGHSLLILINDILDHSKIEAGKLELETTAFNLQVVLDDCVNIFTLSAQQKSLHLLCERSPELSDWVHGDPTRLRQILLNLLSNAIKFTDHGKIHLRVSPTNEPSLLRFEIEDQGIGVAAEKTHHLFRSFQQGDSSMTRKYGGSGLGLAICKQLVELMHGEIGVQSTLGTGSTFWFTATLPPATEPALPAQNLLPADNAHWKDLRVLVVEDNQVNEMIAVALLKRLGIDAHVVHHGKEALALLACDITRANSGFDLVFMDCEMPVLDGYETTRQLRIWEETNQQQRLPVIALTAHAMPEHRERCLAAGMDDHLTKPLSLAALAIALQRWSPNIS
jgi:signal transduction histidine kinase